MRESAAIFSAPGSESATRLHPFGAPVTDPQFSKELAREVARRRTFGIISHPDAGKTTLTEKLLLYGGAIQMAGTVKARKAARYATSDWMAMERERGISVTSSVMQFEYQGFARSEERRVGKECRRLCRSRWSPYH
jgi:hypothetical protein